VQLQARIGLSRTLIAIANKHARILWAILAKGENFDPGHIPAAMRGAIHGTSQTQNARQ